jgi:putative SOS response-associated peptidase YedK
MRTACIRSATPVGRTIAVAGLWERWRGKGHQEIISFTLLTVNADDHPLTRRMHRLGQEKRMLALLDPAEYDGWLERPSARAFELLRQYLPEPLLDVASPKPAVPRRVAPDDARVQYRAAVLTETYGAGQYFQSA